MLISRLRRYTRPPQKDLPVKSKTFKRCNTDKNNKKSGLKRLVTFTAQQIDSYNKQCPTRTKSMFEKLKAAYAKFQSNAQVKKTETNQLMKKISGLQQELEFLKRKARKFNQLKFTIQREHNELLQSLRHLLKDIY